MGNEKQIALNEWERRVMYMSLLTNDKLFDIMGNPKTEDQEAKQRFNDLLQKFSN